jgi:hypothetical protein
MKKLLLILRSRRGDLLVDGMVGAVVAGMIVTATVSLLIVLGQSGVNNSNNSARDILINSVLNEQLPELDSIPVPPATPAITAYPVMGGTVDVAVWREKEAGTGTSILYARTSRYGNTNPAQCRTADKNNAGQCLITRMRLNDDVGGMDVTQYPLVRGVAPSTYIFKTAAPIPASVTEVRYVFKVTEASVASTVKFSGDAGTTPFTVTIPAGQTGFYYGSLNIPAAASNIYITPTSSLVFDDTSFLLYGAPK